MHGIHGAITAATAAANHRRELALLELEETEMTKYAQEELDHNWEFKIMRSATGAFRKPEILQQVLAEESLAGWELLEKLDDNRLRLKRARDARKRDDRLPPGVDPYRTQYGTAGNNVRTIAVILAGLLALGVGAMVFFLDAGGGTNPSAEGSFESTPIISIIILMTIIGLAVAIIAKSRTMPAYTTQRSPMMIISIVIGLVMLGFGVVAYFLLAQ